MRRIKTIDPAYRRNPPRLRVTDTAMGETEAILYGSDECEESTAMAELLRSMGVSFRLRVVNRDDAAMTEWEALDGERVPMLRMGHHVIVRGFDRVRLQQLFGLVGC